MHLTGHYINWKRVWLAVMVGFVLLVIASNLILGYVAMSRPWLIDWQSNPVTEVSAYDK